MKSLPPGQRSPATLIGIGVAALLIAAMSWLTLPLDNADHEFFLRSWITSLDEAGILGTLGAQVANYTAPYIVILGAINAAMPEASTLTVMHVTGLVLHLTLMVAFIFCAVRLNASSSMASIILMAALVPVSLANSIVWGQSDAFFTAFVLLSATAALRRYWIMAFILFSASLSIKLVAVFATPALFVLLVRQGAMWKILWFLPVFLLTYSVMNGPYLLAGLPPMKVATIYLDQAGTYDKLSLNAPNFWYILQMHPLTQEAAETVKPLLTKIGLIAGVVIVAAISFFGSRGTKSNPLNDVDFLWLLALSATVIPFVMTKMHDRYFFLGDASLWLLVLLNRRFWVAAIIAQLGSLMAYTGFLEFTHPYLPVPTHYMIALASLLKAATLILLIFIGVRSGVWQNVFRKDA